MNLLTKFVPKIHTKNIPAGAMLKVCFWVCKGYAFDMLLVLLHISWTYLEGYVFGMFKT